MGSVDATYSTPSTYDVTCLFVKDFGFHTVYNFIQLLYTYSLWMGPIWAHGVGLN
jgi:hypothetical protein